MARPVFGGILKILIVSPFLTIPCLKRLGKNRNGAIIKVDFTSTPHKMEAYQLDCNRLNLTARRFKQE